jgi:hypothetical protein
VKDCLLAVCDILCPDKKRDIESIRLSGTSASRFEMIIKNLTTQLTQIIEKLFSITMNESTDISDTAQLLIFVERIDDFNIAELACSQPTKATATGTDLFSDFKQCSA